MIALDKFEALVCPPTLTIRDGLARINASHPHLFQIVVDAAGKVLGTVTDGDVRRAMLRDVCLEDPVAQCMHAPAVIGHVDDPEGNAAKVREAIFLPVVDGEGVLTSVLIVGADEPGLGHALIMAGGYGTRLGEHTRDVPKPLLPVAGRPILDHVLERLEAAGIREIAIAVHYRAEQIEAFVAERDNAARIRFIHESEPLGTAGALAALAQDAREPVLVINGDLLSHIDFAALGDFHRRHGCDGTIAIVPYDVEIPFGVVRYGEDGLFAGIDEKPTRRQFVAAGVYYLAPEFLALVPAGQPIDMPQLLNRGREIGLKVGLFPVHESWLDIGRPADLDGADAFYERHRHAADKDT